MSSSTGQLQGQMAGGETLEVSSLGRTAECAKSQDGAARSGVAAGAGRFQQWFVSGVGVFLLATGGVKLVSVLQESRVLGAADPLFSGLTVRQVLFLAAGLELAVATVLLRHRTARWAPGLILWLVLAFGAYQLGRWMVGVEGSCGCLGHLFERWPEFEARADWVMLGALAVMGFGSLWSLLLSRHNPFGTGWSKGCSKTIFLLLIAAIGHTGGFAKTLPPLAITAQYRSVAFRPGSTEVIHTVELRISIYSSNRWWRIRTDPLDSGLVPVDWMRIPDGVRSHSMVAANPTVTNWSPAAEAYASPYPLRGHTGLLLAWLAYVPHPELPVLDGIRIRRFLTPDLSRDPRNKGTYHAEWLAPEEAFLAKLSVTNDGLLFMGDGRVRRQKGKLARGWLEFEYVVHQTTNLLDITLPLLGTLNHYWVPPDGSSDELKLVWLETICLIEARPLKSVKLPQIDPKVIAIDYRLSDSTSSRALSYVVTNDIWKPTNDPNLLLLAKIQRPQDDLRSSYVRRGFVVLLTVLFLMPVTVYLFKRMNARSS
jgi:hypothetical protein